MSRALRDRRRWIAIAAALAVVFFVVGLSHEAYDLFSPPAFDWHILLRKTESVVAFFVLGYATDRAILRPGRMLRVGTGTLAIALFSALIEVAQFVHGSHEGLAWSVADVLCGAFGGAVADVVVVAQQRRVMRSTSRGAR